MPNAPYIKPRADIVWQDSRIHVDLDAGIIAVQHKETVSAFSIEMLAELCGVTFEKRGEEILVHYPNEEKKKEVSECLRNRYLM